MGQLAEVGAELPQPLRQGWVAGGPGVVAHPRRRAAVLPSHLLRRSGGSVQQGVGGGCWAAGGGARTREPEHSSTCQRMGWPANSRACSWAAAAAPGHPPAQEVGAEDVLEEGIRQGAQHLRHRALEVVSGQPGVHQPRVHRHRCVPPGAWRRCACCPCCSSPCCSSPCCCVPAAVAGWRWCMDQGTG